MLLSINLKLNYSYCLFLYSPPARPQGFSALPVDFLCSVPKNENKRQKQTKKNKQTNKNAPI